MEDRVRAIVKAIESVAGAEWVSLSSMLAKLPLSITTKDLLAMVRGGLIEAYVDLASGEVYVRVKWVEGNSPKSDRGAIGDVLANIAEKILPELREPTPKPNFEEILKNMVGDGWREVYQELVKRGIVREVEFNGMIFVAAGNVA